MSAGLHPHPLVTPQGRRERRGIPGADQVTNPGTLLALIGPDRQGLRQVTVTSAGPTPDTELSGPPRRTALRVPEPQFPHPTPAGRRLSSYPPLLPAPLGDQPDPTVQAGTKSVEQLREPHYPDDEGTQLLTDAPSGGLAVPAMSARVAAHTADLHRQRSSLPVRSPGQHLHPALQRPPLASRSSRADTSR
jgi:hypothetical protein